jgi:hypothetical protein
MDSKIKAELFVTLIHRARACRWVDMTKAEAVKNLTASLQPEDHDAARFAVIAVWSES